MEISSTVPTGQSVWTFLVADIAFLFVGWSVLWLWLCGVLHGELAVLDVP